MACSLFSQNTRVGVPLRHLGALCASALSFAVVFSPLCFHTLTTPSSTTPFVSHPSETLGCVGVLPPLCPTSNAEPLTSVFANDPKSPSCKFFPCNRSERMGAGVRSAGPEEGEAAFEFGEVGVAGGEGGFAIGCEGGGEAVGVGEFVIGVQLGGEFGEFVAGVHQIDGQLSDFGEDFARHAGTFGAPNGVVHFAPIDHAHEQLAFALGGAREEFLDVGGAGAILEKGHDSAGVENDSFHSSRSRLRSACRTFRADGSPLREPRRLRMNSGVRGWRTRRFSSSTKATCGPLRMAYLRRSLEGMTSWPLVVTVETSVFIRNPLGERIGKVYGCVESKSITLTAYLGRRVVPLNASLKVGVAKGNKNGEVNSPLHGRRPEGRRYVREACVYVLFRLDAIVSFGDEEPTYRTRLPPVAREGSHEVL